MILESNKHCLLASRVPLIAHERNRRPVVRSDLDIHRSISIHVDRQVPERDQFTSLMNANQRTINHNRPAPRILQP